MVSADQKGKIMKQLPTADILRSLARYEPDTGKLFWLARSPDMFASGGHSKEHTCAKWNSKYAGKEAFTAINRQGYRCGAVFDQQYKAHRIAWAVYYGVSPSAQVDHIDGNRTNNAIHNLRDVTNKQNSRSACLPKNNTTGYMGVSFSESRGKYRASIKIDGRQLFLGYWQTPQDAAQAYILARDQHGFSERHGATLQP